MIEYLARQPHSYEPGFCIKYSKYIVDAKGRIAPALSGAFEQYQPFDYYTAPVPGEVAWNVLSDKHGLGSLDEKPLYLHTLFASLEPGDREQLIRFIGHFGMPYEEEPLGEHNGFIGGYPVRRNLRAEPEEDETLGVHVTATAIHVNLVADPEEDLPARPFGTERKRTRRSIPLEEFLDEAWLFRWVMSLSIAYANKSPSLPDILITGAKRIAAQDGCWSWLGPLARETMVEGIEGSCVNAALFLDQIVNDSLVGIRPALKVGSIREANALREKGLLGKVPFPLVFGWTFDSLLAAMYLMLFLDATQGRLLRQCANPLCGRFFLAARQDSQYCSKECQNRCKQRRHKDRVAQASSAADIADE